MLEFEPDIDGRIVLPAFAEPHIHLDTALTAERTSGTLDERARRVVLALVRHGATVVRGHARPEAIPVLAKLREELAGTVALQLVAVVAPDDRVRAAEALAAGADLLGGTVGDDPGVLPEVASGAGVGLDLHAGAVTGALLDRLAGFPQPIAVGHLLAPGVREERLAEAGVAVVVAPGRRCPPGALRRLLDAGVTVAAGSDHVRDHVHPLGRLDPLETAGHLVTAGLTAHEALAAVSGSARRVLGLPVLGVDEVVLIDACSPAEAIAAMPGGRVVSRDGQVVASTALEAWVAA